MDGIRKKSIKIKDLEKRLMFDASLGALEGSTTFGEDTVNTTPQILDSSVTVTGTTTNFDGLSLNISTDGGASDQLNIQHEGNGAGQIGFDGTNVNYNGIQIGTVSSDGTNGTNLTIDLNGNADKAGIKDLIETITYQNISDNPAVSRNITFALDGLFSENITVFIAPDNDAPSIDTNTGMTLAEGGTQTLSAAMLGISDPDNADNDVTITLTSALTKGRLELTTNTGVSISDFTLDDLNNGRVQYVHDSTNTTTDSFDFDVDDGTTTLATDTFNITITPVDDAPVLNANDGADVFSGFSTDIGGTEVPAKFGNELLTRDKDNLGQFGTFEGIIDGNDVTQLRVVITTPVTMPTAVPGQVIFETGGSGRGISLLLNSNNELTFYAGNASNTPEITSPIALATSTQYAIVIELDQPGNEIRMHYAQSGDFTWFEYGRVPEAIDNNFTDSDYSGGNGSGLGTVGSNSIGGYNSTRSGNQTFQGTIDSDFVITEPPAGGTIIENTNLVYADSDTATNAIIYTITSDVTHGTLYKNGVAIGLNDTFTQADLDAGDIDYTHGGGVTPNDSFEFSVTDGTTTLTGNTYAINVITANTAPDLSDTTFAIAEDASNGDNVGLVTATDPDTAGGQILSYSIQGGTGAGIFQIDAASGQISVLNNATLDYETTTSYTLTVRATDDGPGTLFDEATITINIQDVNENTAPTIAAGGPFSINEDAVNNDDVGTVSATDFEGDNITYSIVGGNINNAFKINGSTGLIEVRDQTQLDYENISSYTLRIRATDDNSLVLSSERNFIVNIGDVNEGPSLQIDEVINTINKNVAYNADNGNFYRYYNSNVNFNTALNNAAAATLNGANGHLVTITSNTENTFVHGVRGSHIWLAASDTDVEGQWKWIAGPESGSIFSLGGTATAGFYERWAGSEPNSGTGANVAYMNNNTYWYDQGGGSRHYVVEWESMDVINNREYSLDYSTPGGGDINNGDSIGFVQGGDDDGDTLTYSITAGNGDGVFEIDSASGEIRILDDTNINTAVTSDYTLTVRVDDGSGLFDTKDIAINFNQLLSVGTNNPLAATEGATTTITTAELNIVDSDTPATDLTISITNQPTHGKIALVSSPTVGITSFTQDDLDNNRVIFVSNGDENTTDSFEFSVSDGSYTLAGQTFDINITNTNDSPTINVNTGTNVLEGGSKTITAAMLNSLDNDDIDSGLTYTASNLANGYIQVSGSTQNTFTQADINAGNVSFIHDGSENNGSFDVELADSGADGATTDTATFTLTRTPVNDAPVVSVNTGTSVIEGSTITVTSAMLAATDIDDSDPTLVYTLTSQFNGNFVMVSAPAIPIVSFTQDDLNNNRVMFKHDGNELDGSVEFSVADDGADGASPATGTFTITKIPVNDAPTIAQNTGTSVNQNSIVILKNSVLAAADTDDLPAGIDFTIDSVSGGQLEFLSNPNVAITTFTQDDINNSRVVFRHADPAVTGSFDFTVSDGGEDSAGTASGTFNLTVDNTNNSPTITTNAAQTIDEGTTLSLDTTMLDSFDPDDFGTGLTWSVSNLQSGIVQVAGVTQNSFTQADLDNGDITFIHDGSQTLSAGFTITLADGGENDAVTDTAFFKINVNQINNLPSIDTNTGSTLAEGGSTAITDTDLNASDSDVNSADWYDANWDYRQKITLESDYVSTDLTDFTVLISGDNFSRDFWDNVKADGSDIVITLSDGTKLDRELVSINRGAEKMELHVKVPLVSSTVDTDLFIYYGNAGASESNDAAATFANYDHVYHMNQLNAVDVIGANNGTNSGGGSITTGILGNAHSYSGAGIIDLATISGNDVRSVSFWYKAESSGGGNYGTLLGSDNYNNGIRHLSTDAINLRSNSANLMSSTPDFGEYKHLVFSYDDGAGTINLYENGVLQDSNAFGGWYDIEHLVGIAGDDARAIDGIIDEVRITDAIITQAQAATEYANQGTPSLFYSLSGQQQYVPEVLTYTVTTATSHGTLYLDANSNGTLDGGETLALNDTYTQDDIDAGRIRYDHDGGESTTDSFGFTVSDAHGATAVQTYNFTITPVNDAPVISTNTGTTISEGSNVTLTTGMLDVTDPDDLDTNLTWTASNLLGGTIEVSGTAQNTFTQAQLDAGDVVFIHDGSETITAGFDINVADDDGLNASGNFAITVTPVNDAPTMILNDGDPNVIDLNDYTIDSYGGAQDAGGTFNVSADGSTLTFTNGNMWKQIAIPYTLTSNTVLSFEFFADSVLEVQGIGFENDGGFGFVGYELLGTQNWQLDDSFRGYQVGDGWVRYDIDIGSDYTGAMTSLVLAMDNDGNLPGTQAFRNINFYESNQVVAIDEGASLTLTNAHLNSIDPDDTPATRIFSASNISNGHIEVSGVTQNPFTQADINNGDVVFVHDGSETLSAGFDITLQDDDGAGTDTGHFDIIINAVDDAPVAATNNGLTVNEASTTTITTAALTTSDADTQSRNVIFTLTDNVDNGRIALSSDTATAINSFTLQDLQNGHVVYVHDGSETIADSFDFTVTDGNTTLGADTFSITVTPVNDAVSLDANTGANVGESDLVTISNTMLSTSDTDNGAAQITYTITAINNGWVELTTNSGFPVSSFTQSDINNNRVIFRHDGSGANSASFTFSVNDTGADGTSPATGTFSLNVINPVNEAPVIAVSDGTPNTIDFSSKVISPYDASGVGDGQSGTPTDYRVSSDGSVLTLYGNAWKRIAMPMTVTADTVITFDFRSTKEGEIHGIGFDTNNDFVSTDNFYEFFGTDANGGFVQTYNTYNLGDGWTRIEIPVGNDFTGAITELVFLADDDAGADAISQFRNMSIYEANPSITLNEGGTHTITNTTLNAFDPDDAPNALTYTASNLSNGHIEVSGVTQNTFTQADIDNGDVVFVHDGGESLTAGFDLSLQDDDNAGTTSSSLNFTINPVNDAPTISGDATLTVAEAGNVTLTALDLGSADPDDIPANRIFTVTNLSNGHIEVSGVTQNTFTQADIDNGDVVFVHDGSETLSAGFDVALLDDAGAGTDTANVTINVTPVNNATPSDIMLDNDIIAENSANGTLIGQLSAIDTDSVDTMTYSLMDDAGGLFMIDGNQLIVNGALDFEAASARSIIVRVEDAAGHSFDKTMDITITDVLEADLTNPVSNTSEGGPSPAANILSLYNKREIFRVSDILNPEERYTSDSLIESVIHNRASDVNFYSENMQILRENTTVLLQNFLGTLDSIILPADVSTVSTDPDAGPVNRPDTADQSFDDGLKDFTSYHRDLKEVLLELQKLDTAEGKNQEFGQDIAYITSIDDQFRNVLTYQQQKQAALREALLKS
ncbi:MAG: hypothetical protein CMH27_08630 [Micavibrio sp.]|nr:hypothetical protein [Micavibrio sp.]